MLRVYWTPDKGKPGWTVAWVAPGGAGRQRKWFSAKGKARKFALDTAKQLQAGASKVITAADMANLGRARAIVKRWNVSVEVACLEYSRIRKAAGDATISEILDHWRATRARVAVPIGQAVDSFLKAKAGDGIGERHSDDLEKRLGDFKAAHPGLLNKLRPEIADAWLRGLRKADGKPLGAQTRNHYRAALLNFLHYARRQRWLSFDPLEWAEDYPPLEVARGRVEIFTPEEAVKLLRSCWVELLPALVLGLFSGLRPSETMRVQAEGLDFGAGVVYDFAGKVRTAGDRIAPLLPVSIAWLQPLKLEGAVAKYATPESLAQAFMKLADRAGVEWKHDGPRHSFVSYRLAVTGDLAKISEETGTDAKTLRKHYRRPVLREVADKWFALDPWSVRQASGDWTAPDWWNEFWPCK